MVLFILYDPVMESIENTVTIENTEEVKDPFEGMTDDELIKDQQDWAKEYIQSRQYKKLLSRELILQDMIKNNEIATEEKIGTRSDNEKDYDVI